MKLTEGKDPTTIPGLTDASLLKIGSEIGYDLKYWESSNHFTAWIGLAPKKNSSGKMKKNKKVKGNDYVSQVFKEAAQSVGKMKNDPLGIFYRRIKASRGALIAVKATARKIAVLFYSIMSSTIEKYINPGVEEYSKKMAEGQIKYLRKKAQALGMQLVDTKPQFG